jgi:hypothetical protein
MPETFHAATDAPVIEYVGDREIILPVLDIDDLTLWAAELKAQRRKADAKRIAALPDAFSRFRAEKYADENEPAIDELASLSRSPAGGKKVLDLSLAKAGVKDAAERAAIVKAIPPWRFEMLARDVSRLFPPLPPYPLQEPANPNPPAGGSAGEPTGSSGSESSTSTPGNGSGE